VKGPELRINPSAAPDRHPIADGQECLVFDDFLLDPGAVVDWAAAHREAFFTQERGYPGLILPLGLAQADSLHGFIRSRLSRSFGFLRGGIHFQTQLCLTTLKPEDFSWIQCLPHSDPRLEPGRVNFATVLYLFEDPALGGTGFYRWKDAAFWQDMTTRQLDDPAAGLESLRERFEMFRGPWAYTTESNEAVELLTMVPAKFNRLICYSGDIPHNAYVTDPDRLVADPTRGRLTLNSFASVWPRG
jgi:hypothetical protein